MAKSTDRAGGPGRGHVKPTERKRRLGNPGMKTLPKDVKILDGFSHDETPEPLRPLSERAREAWDQAWTAGRFWMSESDLQVLQAWAEALDDYLRWRVYAHQNPEDMDASKRLERVRASFLKMSVELGLTPVARSRLQVAEVRVQEGVARLIQAPTVTEMTT